MWRCSFEHWNTLHAAISGGKHCGEAPDDLCNTLDTRHRCSYAWAAQFDPDVVMNANKIINQTQAMRSGILPQNLHFLSCTAQDPYSPPGEQFARLQLICLPFLLGATILLDHAASLKGASWISVGKHWLGEATEDLSRVASHSTPDTGAAMLGLKN